MATTAVTILVKTLGDSKLKTLDDRLKSVDKSAERVGGSTTRAANGIAATGRSALGASTGVKSFGASLKAALGPIAAVAATIGGVTAGFREINAFNFSGAKVKTLGVDLEALKTELKAVGEELGGSRSQADLLAASYDVASAGFREAADAALVLKAASLGASGGFATLDVTANAATSVLNAYGLSAKDAGRVVDQFVQTQNDGKIIVAEYAQNIGKVAAAAAGLKVPLSEINAVIAQSTIAGVRSEVAFTGLKVALQRLASGEAAKAIEDTGINISAASLESEGLFKTLKKLEGLDVGLIFKALGAEAGPALLPVLNNLKEYERLIKNQEAAVNTSKEAQLEAAATLQGAYARLGNAFSDAFTAQEGAVVALIPLIDGVTAAVNGLTSPLGETVIKIGLVTAAVYALRKALLALNAAGFISWLTRLIPLLAAGKGGLVLLIAKTKLLTAAQLALNSAILLNPWVLLAAGVTAVGVAAFNATKKINDMRNKMNDVSGTTQDLKGRMVDIQNEINRLTKELDGAGNSARGTKRKIAELKAALENLKGVYEIEIALRAFLDTSGVDTASLDKGFYGPAGGALKPKVKTETDLPTVPTGGSSGGGGGAAPRESELPQLQRNLELSDKLLAVDRARLEAQFQGNTEEIKRLSNLRVAFELEGKIADITAEKIPEQEKQAKVLLAQNEAARAALDILYEDKELQKQKAEALEGTLRPIQDEITLLQAKLNGNEEEIKQLIEIRDLKKQITENGGDPDQAAALVKQRDELTKQAEAADKLKAQYESLADSISSSLTGALRSVVDGSKSAEEALSDAFKGIADAFLDMAMKMIQEWIKMQIIGLVGSLFGGGPAASPLKGTLPGTSFFEGRTPGLLAAGGTATGGQPYVVGEKGPELFLPGVTGTVTNNDQFEAAYDAMSGSGGGSSTAFSENSDAIAVSNSYTRERTLERERNETSTSSGTMLIETQVINNVEYATVDQVDKAAAASAKQARAQVFSDMKNKPSTRRQLGIS